MKNQKSNGLAFEKKSISELQKNTSIEIEGGNYIVQAANAARAIQENIDKMRFTQK